MRRSFDLGGLATSARTMNFRDPRVSMRILVGVLLGLNLAVAAFTFHVFGRSARDVAEELTTTRSSVLQQRNQLERTRQIAGKVEKARTAGDQFLATYMTPRRTTYSTIVAELQDDVATAGLTWKDAAIAPLEPIKGSEDLSIMTVTAAFEGPYGNLLKFLNLLDRSQRFLIIDQLAATPQPSGKTLSITIKVNSFIRGDSGGAI